MNLTGIKYGFLASFCREQMFFNKTKGLTHLDLTGIKYGFLASFCREQMFFNKTKGLTHLDFEPKLDIF
jgi:hypothetical protein